MSTSDQEELKMVSILTENAKIKIFLRKDTSKGLLATAQVLLGGVIEINGFTVRVSKYDEQEYWIQPPTFGPKYNKSFWIDDKKLWRELTERVERHYKNKLEEEDIDNEINIRF